MGSFWEEAGGGVLWFWFGVDWGLRERRACLSASWFRSSDTLTSFCERGMKLHSLWYSMFSPTRGCRCDITIRLIYAPKVRSIITWRTVRRDGSETETGKGSERGKAGQKWRYLLDDLLQLPVLPLQLPRLLLVVVVRGRARLHGVLLLRLPLSSSY